MRYQVLYARNGKSEVENFRTKIEARARVRVLAKEGVSAQLWDTLHNPISDLFEF